MHSRTRTVLYDYISTRRWVCSLFTLCRHVWQGCMLLQLCAWFCMTHPCRVLHRSGLNTKPASCLLEVIFVLQGFILDKKIGVGQKKKIENAKVCVANTPMDTDKIKMYGARVKCDSMAKVADIEQAERAKMKEKCDKIIAQGINVFINRQLIYNYPEELFTDAGVMSIEHAGALLRLCWMQVEFLDAAPVECSLSCSDLLTASNFSLHVHVAA